ncbi:restriction endonuclease subunit S, partial [Ureaplasma urealyticum]
PFYSLADLLINVASRYISIENNKFIDEPAILFSSTATIGNVCYVEEKCWFNDQIKAFISKDSNVLNTKYLYYWFLNNKHIIKSQANKGSVFSSIGIKELVNMKINLPSIEEQNAIISIIEPLDILENKINKLKTVLKKLLINIYDKNCNSHVNLFENNKIYTNKYLNQNLYCDTSCIGELEINFSKMINISLEDKPSRADLSIKNNSIIFSKLLGENKVYCFLNNENIVFSTGFFNIKSNDENNDDLLSFLLSSDFKNQKSMLANGTTMIGINNSDLTKVRCKAPFLNSNIYFTFFNKLNEIENKITLARNKIVNLLIK